MRLGMGLLVGAMAIGCMSGCSGSGYSMRVKSPCLERS